MYLEVDGESQTSVVDEPAVLKALKKSAERSQCTVAILRGNQDFLSVALGTDQPITLMKVSPGESGAVGEQLVVVPEPPLSLDKLAELFVSYAGDKPGWQEMVDWNQSVQEQAVAEAMSRGRILTRKIARIALVLLVVLLAVCVLLGKLPVIGAAKFLFVLISFGAYLSWLHFAFHSIRPAAAKWLRAAHGTVVYSGGEVGFGTAGQWEIAGDAPLWLRLALPVIDLTISLSLVIIPFTGGALGLVYIQNGFSF